MKRKFFCVLAVVVGIFFSTEVFAGIYFKTWCGVEGMTVGPECFKNGYDFGEYLQELNEAYCDGQRGKIDWVSDRAVELDFSL
ncbi:hypothetical protein TFUB4_01774 [Tannerella forsythia]|uniref:hypothetical protein n=1 Tax=Tannerella forsythia TaxID=28112 RepID=UPI00062B1A56|nr:hypothetical protein [Tannerella forsythia]KKY62656.1 hypothetical protein Tanf_00870 [Tannerella forsythia]OLQ19711.1 hypothetical protein BGK60_08200 [Tannerella forsythia]TPE16189.1 hypothetical protein FJN16_07865 [Tannerella forsythia]SCQ21754.1 hypothetical protein TFUB4_01774 [Tannerella forsythia]